MLFRSPDSGPQATTNTQDNVSNEPGSLSRNGNNDRAEKQQDGRWVQRSDNSKKKQKRKNANYRRNLRKRREKKQKDAENETKAGGLEKDVESDEWDPWRQATGPDAQKDTTVDLDY